MKLAVKATKSGTIQFIEPMYARLVQKLPEGEGWLYEVKFDGYRCLAGRDSSKVTLWSRRGNIFTAQFPIIARACGRLPSETLLGGEIVAVDEQGRISFSLLQHHRSKAQALLFYRAKRAGPTTARPPIYPPLRPRMRGRVNRLYLPDRHMRINFGCEMADNRRINRRSVPRTICERALIRDYPD